MIVEQNTEFWKQLDTLVAGHEIIIDRPKGSSHWYYTDFIYPLDYGYLKDTKGPDGEPVDIWTGTDSDTAVNGILVFLDTNRTDFELKIIYSCTEEEQKILTQAYNSHGVYGFIQKNPLIM